MLFEISMKNIKKSYKDYAIYFLTLILGVGIFYVFNSLDSQQAMLDLSNSTREIIKLMVTMLSGVSVGVSVILGFLIIYANGFLVRRRKKEFGIYMSLGMSKRNISYILVGETIIIGIVSLVIGLAIGVFASQFMSILIGRMFEADMSRYRFVFSKEASIKTILYFGIMFLLVILFNAISIGRYKLVDLLNASRRNQKVKLKNPIVAVVVFIVSVALLVYSYYSVTEGYETLNNKKIIVVIIMGSVATYLFFWSLSGFFLAVMQKRKTFYLRDLNAFVLRQIHNKINTMVFTMTIICLMLFVSISAISTGMSLKESCNNDIRKSAPADVSITKEMSKKKTKSISEVLQLAGFDLKQLDSNMVEIPRYESEQLSMRDLVGEKAAIAISNQFPLVQWETPAEIYAVSDYNRLAKLYGKKTYSLKDDEYVAICNFTTFKEYQDESLKDGVELVIDGKSYKPKYNSCKSGMIMLGSQRTSFNIVILPDAAFNVSDSYVVAAHVLAANYKADDEEGLEIIEANLNEAASKDIAKGLSVFTEISVKESSIGVAAIVTFVGIYIGIIFLVTSAALLALKELSETSDNKERYALLQKLGADEDLVHRSLFMQIGIFFFMPLLLAVLHSVFGIIFINKMFVILLDKNLMKPIVISILIYGIIYMIYFLSTYFGSKRILNE